MDKTIATQELQVERKHFVIAFCENERGRFLKISEDAHGRRNTVIIPSTGVTQFVELLDQVVAAGADSQPA